MTIEHKPVRFETDGQSDSVNFLCQVAGNHRDYSVDVRVRAAASIVQLEGQLELAKAVNNLASATWGTR